jgi:hypothetical protein
MFIYMMAVYVYFDVQMDGFDQSTNVKVYIHIYIQPYV